MFVQYGGNEYPDGIKPSLVEVAGHLDKEMIDRISAYSLHTEYSYGKRKLDAIDRIYPYQDLIRGIHVWGKKKSSTGRWVAHSGTLDTYLERTKDKETFIEGIKKICSDGRTRFLVPEVNSGEDDLKSVVRDVLRE